MTGVVAWPAGVVVVAAGVVAPAGEVVAPAGVVVAPAGGVAPGVSVVSSAFEFGCWQLCAVDQVRDHRLLRDMHDPRRQRQRLAPDRAGDSEPVPALVDLVERRDRARTEPEPRPESPRRLARRARRLGPDRARDRNEMRAQLGAALLACPAAEARKRLGVGRIEDVQVALEGQIVVEMKRVLGRERGAAEGAQQGRLERGVLWELWIG